MATSAAPSRLVRRRMSYADYLALPESVRAEWVDGEVVVTPSPTYPHQQAARRVANLVEAALPELYVVEAVTVRLPHSRERIPDVSVLRTAPEEDHITEVPLVAVEVLSPGTRSEDTVRKSTEYLAAGVHQYWLVDPAESIVEVFENTAEGWAVLARLDRESPRASVEVGTHGRVDLDLAQVLG